MSALATMPRGLKSPELALCLNCAEYIRDVGVLCPHCGADPTVPGGRYKDESLYARDAMARLLEAMERAGVDPQEVMRRATLDVTDRKEGHDPKTE